ncbi:hypothetical protein EDD21DRAFT_389667 [Dissophora ornata]|nr:hypothetical protein EDD21DRAFT_389667 [Dissophora ornata]
MDTNGKRPTVTLTNLLTTTLLLQSSVHTDRVGIFRTNFWAAAILEWQQTRRRKRRRIASKSDIMTVMMNWIMTAANVGLTARTSIREVQLKLEGNWQCLLPI